MTASPSPLPPGPAPLTSGGLEVVGAQGRVGDGLVYLGTDRGIAARLREYAPAGIVARGLDGALQPAEPAFADALTDGTRRFRAQADRLAGFSHPGIAPVWRSEAVEGGTSWSIGAPTGPSLRHALDVGVVFTPAEVVRFAGEMADVLADLHGRGLAHLDIAPETISVAAGRAQLADFAVDNRSFIALLHGHEGLVRPGYSPIEHYDAGMEEPLGPAADVHAASALVYRLVTGREPPAWQARWRDPDAAALPDRDDYPTGFLAAIRTGMAIEPGDRFASGAEWRAALNLPRRISPQVPSVISAAADRSGMLVPVALGIGLLVLLLLAVLGWRQGWFGPASGMGDIQVTGPDNHQQPPPEPVASLIRAGDTVEGQLTVTDPIGPGGGYRDGYRLQGRRGDRVAIGVRAGNFTPTLSLFGPGLAGQQGEAGRITLTLPQDGAYIILVGAPPGVTGPYSLAVVPAHEDGPEPGPIDPAAARRLAGTWHGEGDDICKIPAVNSVQGDLLIARIGPDTFRHRIEAADADGVDTVIENGPLAGERTRFRMAPDGDSYDVDGETWTRC